MTGHPTEQPLTGGNVTTGIVRVGDTVRRPSGPWSESVDAVLLHLESAGYRGAPRALGYDGLGRQVLSWVEGSVLADPSDLSPARLGAVGASIREFHDAVSSFVAPVGARWNVAIPPDAEDIVCHHDLAPWNLVRGGHDLVFIDWDGAGPGTRLWDLAYAAHGFVPLSSARPVTDPTAAERLRTLVDGYGLDDAGRRDVLDMLAPRIESMCDLLERGHAGGVEPWRRLRDEGHRERWSADALYVEDRRELWQRALLG